MAFVSNVRNFLSTSVQNAWNNAPSRQTVVGTALIAGSILGALYLPPPTWTPVAIALLPFAVPLAALYETIQDARIIANAMAEQELAQHQTG